MSAPDTEPERQTRRHRPSLIGIAVSVLFAIVLLAGLMVWVFARGEDPGNAAAEIDGRTGEVVAE